MRAFVVKTKDEDGNIEPRIFESLRNGRARIGWSYSDDLDLHLVTRSTNDGKWESLSADQKDAWYCHRFLEEVQEGDLLFYPHQPEYGKFAIARVAGPYGYAPDNDSIDGDFRSFRPCELLTHDPVSWTDHIVPPIIKTKLGQRRRFYELWAPDAIEELMSRLPHAGRDRAPGDSLKLGLRAVFDKFVDRVPPLLMERFPRQQFSHLLDELFKKMGYLSVYQEGAGERGSDVVVTIEDPLLPTPIRVGVQAFAWEGNVGPDDLRGKLEQLVAGWDENELDYGVLATTGMCGEEAEKLIEAHNDKQPDGGSSKPKLVRLLHGRDLARLFLEHFAELATRY